MDHTLFSSRPLRGFVLISLLGAAAALGACTGERSGPSAPNLLLEYPETPAHRHEAHLPGLEAVIGPHYPGAGGRAGLIAGSALTAPKLVFPLDDRDLDIDAARGWKQVSNALSLALLNDLARLNDSKIRWIVRNFREDMPRLALDPFLIEKRLALYARWSARLAAFKLPSGLTRTERLNLEADVRALRKYLERETRNDRRELELGDIRSLFLNPVWNAQNSPNPASLQAVLSALAPADGPGYFPELRRKLQTRLDQGATIVNDDLLSFFTKDETRAAYLTTLRKPFEKTATPERREALARLETDVHAFGQWLREHGAALAPDRSVAPAARTEAELILKYRAAGIDDDPDAILAFGERRLREIGADMQALRGAAVTTGGSFAHAALLEMPPLRSSADMLGAFHRMSAGLDELLRAREIITLPPQPIKIVECNVPQYPYKENRSFCRNLVASMFADNYMAHSQVSSGVADPQVVFPAFEYLRDKAPQFLSAATSLPVLAHEGRPGHELQFRSFARGEGTLARSFLSEQRISVEGWALYAEKLVEEALGEIPPALRLEFLRLRQWRAARVVLESRLYRGGLSEAEAVDYLTDVVGLDRATAADEVKARYLDRDFPSDASYLYGYEQLLELREKLRRELGSKFNLKRFNDAVVKMGFLAPGDIHELVRAEMTAP